MKFRIEKDSMGDVQVPQDALYAAQTGRAIANFPVSGIRMPEEFIRALLQVKKAAAASNVVLDQLPKETGGAIIQAVDQLLEDDDLMIHFPIDVYQTGSGTSSNMNANEVLATLASKISGSLIHPNDHINYGQSSNDVIPTTIHVSASIQLEQHLLPSLEHLVAIIKKKAVGLKNNIKTGRTHLMDAMPVSFAQSLNTWANQIEYNITNLKNLQPSIQSLAQGGTAVGTGVNAHQDFAQQFNKELSKNTGVKFTPAKNFFTHISSQDIAVSLSGQLKTTAVSIFKIANDLRWMNSGPLAGLGEIELEALQPGSSIMPGKVNPVVPESAAQVAAQVIGNDAAITIAGQSGNFELNVMLPLVAHNLLSSIKLLGNVSTLLADKAIASFIVNQKNIDKALARNPILVTALNPIIGYNKAAEIAKIAYKEKSPVLDIATEQTDIEPAELERLLDPKNLSK